jgi:hypothetical protein
MRTGRQLRVAATTVVVLMLGAVRLDAAAPRLVMFYGGAVAA